MRFTRNQRLRVPERMDADDVDVAELGRALRFIRGINRMLRYNAAVVKRVGRELAGCVDQVTILDVATGSGDLLVDLHAWARRSARGVRLIGMDRHATTLEAARATVGDRATLVRGDALALPFADRSVDVITCGLFLHHLSDNDAVRAIAEMVRVARCAVIIADLIRSRRAYAWITLLTLGSGEMVKHDARASVAQAFSLAEARRIAADATTCAVSTERTFGHRFVLTIRCTGHDAPRHSSSDGPEPTV